MVRGPPRSGVRTPEERNGIMTISVSVPASLDTLPGMIGAWPRTHATVAAVEFVETHEAPYLVNHSIRSYFYAARFGALGGLAAGTDYDDELLFLGTVLHDIGLTEIANGTQRFEVDGADAAAAFAREQGLGDAAAEIVWDAVALHTSPGIASRKRAEIALAFFGIGADIFELGADALDDELVLAAHDRYPRLGLRTQLTRAVADQVRDKPAKHVPSSFPADAVRHVHPDLPLPGIPEIIANGRWAE